MKHANNIKSSFPQMKNFRDIRILEARFLWLFCVNCLVREKLNVYEKTWTAELLYYLTSLMCRNKDLELHFLEQICLSHSTGMLVS